MKKILKKVLLLALPASGKSEVRRYLHSLSKEECESDFHMGPTVQLDDFPYVHLMRCIDDELENLGESRIYFTSAQETFADKRDWGTLISLINEDYSDLVNENRWDLDDAGSKMISRIDAASHAVGIESRLSKLSDELRAALASKLDSESREILKGKNENIPDTLEGKTVVIEFARGGPDGAAMPLVAPHGYGYALSVLSEEILEDASVLYVWVTPEESRRKNEARTDPNDPGSILHHGVPISVMMQEYGCDDMDWLESTSEKDGTVTIVARDTTFHLPVARFDNRVDKTSFIRDEPADWNATDVAAIHGGMKSALDKLIEQRS